MPRNSSRSSYLTQGAQGAPTPDPSTYPPTANLEDTNPHSHSDSSHIQLAQDSTGNTSRQYDDNNRGGDSAYRGNSASNATSGQSHHGSEGASHSSSRTNSNQNDNRDSGSYVPIPGIYGSSNMGSQSYGGTNSNSNSLSGSRLADWVRQSEGEGPYNAMRRSNSDSRGGSGGHGSADGVGQSEGHGTGYGGGGSQHEERGYDNGDGDRDSLDVERGSQGSARSSGGRN